MDADSYLGQLVVIRDVNGRIEAVGRCCAFTDQPTITVLRDDGTRSHYIASRAEVLDVPEDVAERLISFTPENQRGGEFKTNAPRQHLEIGGIRITVDDIVPPGEIWFKCGRVDNVMNVSRPESEAVRYISKVSDFL